MDRAFGFGCERVFFLAGFFFQGDSRVQDGHAILSRGMIESVPLLLGDSYSGDNPQGARATEPGVLWLLVT